jgi:hypothetical protein
MARKTPDHLARVVFEVDKNLKRDLEAALTPPGMTKPPFGAMQRFFERRMREHVAKVQAKERKGSKDIDL